MNGIPEKFMRYWLTPKDPVLEIIRKHARNLPSREPTVAYVCLEYRLEDVEKRIGKLEEKL